MMVPTAAMGAEVRGSIGARAIITLALLAASVVPVAAEEANESEIMLLRYRHPEGRVLHWRSERVQSQKIEGVIRVETLTIASTETVIEEGVDDQPSRVRTVIDRVRLDVKEGDRAISSMDTDDPLPEHKIDADELAANAVWYAMVDRPLVLLMDDEGNVDDVQGIAEIAQAARTLLGENNQLARSLVEARLQQRAMKSEIAALLGWLPVRPVGFGESWEVKSIEELMDGVLTIERTTDYTLRPPTPAAIPNVEQDLVIDAITTITGDVHAKNLGFMGSEGEGVITFNQADGRLTTYMMNWTTTVDRDGKQSVSSTTLRVESELEAGQK